MISHKAPARTLHAKCHYCVQSRSDPDVENCTGYIVFATGKPCPFYEYRMGNKRPSVKVMRTYCLECMGGSKTAVKECGTEDCLIHPYRFGKNPARAGKGQSSAQMASLRSIKQVVSKKNPVCFERLTTARGIIHEPQQ
ncbi:MAG: hypothetical protein K4571_18335 [Deltaproteobacteria bacterium]